MKSHQISVLMYGHDASLLDSRKWVLESRGYRVHTIQRLSQLNHIPATSPVSLLVLCHTLTSQDAVDASTRASARWPGLKQLQLVADSSRYPSQVLGQVMHTLDGPGRLIHKVSELVGHSASSTYSHIY